MKFETPASGCGALTDVKSKPDVKFKTPTSGCGALSDVTFETPAPGCGALPDVKIRPDKEMLETPASGCGVKNLPDVQRCDPVSGFKVYDRCYWCGSHDHYLTRCSTYRALDREGQVAWLDKIKVSQEILAQNIQ